MLKGLIRDLFEKRSGRSPSRADVPNDGEGDADKQRGIARQRDGDSAERPIPMKSIDISFELLSYVVWTRILQSTSFKAFHRRGDFFRAVDELERLRPHADYDTGSISSSSAWLLYSAAFFFTPKYILEIGTFIGKSTLSLAFGVDGAGRSCEIHTCDASNELDLPNSTKSTVVQYKRQQSTEMLGQLVKAGKVGMFDFAHLDGRLQTDDLPLLARVLVPDAVIALDDFEGIEKGVANLIRLRESNVLRNHVIVYPCSLDLLRRYGLEERSTTALMVPTGLIRITAQ